MNVRHWSNEEHEGALQFGLSFRETGETKNVSSQLLTERGEQFLASVNVHASRAVLAGLVHGNAVAEVGENEIGKTIFVHDGLITRTTNVCLAVTISDCFALVLFDPVGPWLSVLHAGWRGVTDGIVHKACEQKRVFDDRVDRLCVWISPGIQGCHFEVGPDAASLFERQQFREGKFFVDLQATLVQQFKEEGISSIFVDGRCTACDPARFFSYRRDKPAQAQTMLAYAVMR